MSIDQQIAANEKTFQEWFQRSWDAHHKESPSAADFKDVGDPRPTTRQKSYDYLDKRTVRVMVDFQSRPDDFVQLLQDYLINNALLLYQDSIRIANLPGSVSFYKDCGDQVGLVECHLSREGQIVTVAVGYQMFKKSIALTFDPLRQAKQTNTHRVCALEKKEKDLQLIVPKASILSILMALMFGLSVLYIGLFMTLLIGLLIVTIFAQEYLVPQLNRKAILKKKVNAHRQHDLSHNLFPVAYHSKGKVTAALSENKDHAAFLERIRSVVDRAVAFGESSHNQRS